MLNPRGKERERERERKISTLYSVTSPIYSLNIKYSKRRIPRDHPICTPLLLEIMNFIESRKYDNIFIKFVFHSSKECEILIFFF